MLVGEEGMFCLAKYRAGGGDVDNESDVVQARWNQGNVVIHRLYMCWGVGSKKADREMLESAESWLELIGPNKLLNVGKTTREVKSDIEKFKRAGRLTSTKRERYFP